MGGALQATFEDDALHASSNHQRNQGLEHTPTQHFAEPSKAMPRPHVGIGMGEDA